LSKNGQKASQKTEYIMAFCQVEDENEYLEKHSIYVCFLATTTTTQQQPFYFAKINRNKNNYSIK